MARSEVLTVDIKERLSLGVTTDRELGSVQIAKTKQLGVLTMFKVRVNQRSGI